ncbi:hypothetical protein L9F63_022466, partial [Diploptera punctata]
MESIIEENGNEDPLVLEEDPELHHVDSRIKEEVDVTDEVAVQMISQGADNFLMSACYPDDLPNEDTTPLQNHTVSGNTGDLFIQTHFEKFSNLASTYSIPSCKLPSNNYVCNICKQIFTDLVTVKEHMKVNCDSYKLYSCYICKKSYTTISQLTDHLFIHKETGNFSCQDCGKSYSRLNFLRNHICESKELSYSCLTCRKMFKSKLELSIHSVKHGNVENEQPSYSSHTEERLLTGHMILNKPFWCCICKKSFTNNSQLESHLCSDEDGYLSHLEEVCADFEPGDNDTMQNVSVHTSAESIQKLTNNNNVLEKLNCFKSDESIIMKSDCMSTSLIPFYEMVKSEMEDIKEESEHINSVKISEKEENLLHMLQTQEIPPESSEISVTEEFNISLQGDLSAETICSKEIGVEHGKQIIISQSFSPNMSEENDNSFNMKMKEITMKCKTQEFEHNFDCDINVSESVINSFEQNYVCSCNVCNKTFAILLDFSKHDIEKEIFIFTCHFCSKAFIGKNNLTKHICIHSEKQPYSCHICGKFFVEKSSLVIHWHEHRDKQHNSACFPSKSMLNSDERSELQEQVPNTVLKIEFPDTLKTLNDVVLQQQNNSICNKNFAHRADQDMHLINRNDLFSCYLCNKLFTTQVCFLKHLASHTVDKLFSCNLCKKTFVGKDSLLQHMSMHNSSYFVCNMCNTKFYNRSTYLSHICIHEICSSNDKQNKQDYVACDLTNKTEKGYNLCALTDNVDCITTNECSCKSQSDEENNVFDKELIEKMGNISESTNKSQCDSFESFNKNLITSCEREDIFNCKICKNTFKGITQVYDHLFTHISESSPLTCPICEKLFDVKSDLRHHFYIHTGIPNPFCDVCKKSFENIETMKKHLKTHKEEIMFQNTFCDEFSSQSEAENQNNTHCKDADKNDCNMLNNTSSKSRTQFFIESQLKDLAIEGSAGNSEEIMNNSNSRNLLSDSAFKNHSGEENGKYKKSKNMTIADIEQANQADAFMIHQSIGKPCFTKLATSNINSKPSFICNLCNGIFQGKNALTQHLISHGSREKPFTCLICSKTFNHKINFIRHVCIHTGIRSLICSYCKMSFPDNCSLKKHLRIHTGERAFLCHICKKSFVMLSHFKSHMKIHIDNDVADEDINVVLSGNEMNAQLHEKINYHYLTTELPNHVENNSIIHAKQKKKDVLQKSCSINSEILTPETKKSLKSNMLREIEYSVDYSVQQSTESFPNFNEEKIVNNAHVENSAKKSNKTSKFKCILCDEVFSNAKYLTNHLIVHTSTDRAPFLCPICNIAFNQKFNLKKHLCIHTGVHPFSCTYCEKPFFERSALNNHVSIHLKGRPYKCNICRQNFRLKSFLKSHVKRQHVWSDFESLPQTLSHAQMLVSSSYSKKNHTGTASTVFNLKNRVELIDPWMEEGKDMTEDSVCFVGTEILSPGSFIECPELVSESDKRKEFSSVDHLEGSTKQMLETDKLGEVSNLEEIVSTNSDKTQEKAIAEKTRLTNVTCIVCNKIFSNVKVLTNHLIIHSSSNYPFFCPICNKIFCQINFLRKHLSIHIGVQPYSGTFYENSVTEKSISVHFQDRPFECHICNQKFLLKSLLMHHLNKMHVWETSSDSVYYSQKESNIFTQHLDKQINTKLIDIGLVRNEELPKNSQVQTKEVCSDPVNFVNREVSTSEENEEFFSADYLIRQIEKLPDESIYNDRKELAPDYYLEENIPTFTNENISKENLNHA